jgi:hypothetical protein
MCGSEFRRLALIRPKSKPVYSDAWSDTPCSLNLSGCV